MPDLDLQTVLSDGDFLKRSGSDLVGMTATELAADTAFTDEYATIAALNAVIAAEGNLPVGGTVGQVLSKSSSTNFDAAWTTFDVDAAGAVMNADTSTASMSFVIDEDSMATDSATKVPTQQSVKAYVDAVVVSESSSLPSAGAVIVASSQAPTNIRTAADYVCDGTADEVQINAAILDAAALPANGGPTGGEQRGRVCLTGGNFNIAAPILMRTGVWLMGQGPLTRLIDDNISSTSGAGGSTGIIKLFDVDTHLTCVSDLTLDGNYASGGAGHGIVYNNLSGSFSTYPDSSPDPDHTIRNLFLKAFTTGTRHAIFLEDNCRGTQIQGVSIQNCSGNGVRTVGTPDSHMSHVHIGTCTLSGVYVDGGNWKLDSVKAYYCDQWGFDFQNARMTAQGLEVQDCANGIRFAAADVNVTGMLIDTIDTTAISIASDRTICKDFTILHRGGRYPGDPTDTGVLLSAGLDGCHISGSINATDVTTKVSGTASASTNEIAIWNGTTMYRGT